MADGKDKNIVVDDLEDGEIESDDDDCPIIVSVTPATTKIPENLTEKSTNSEKKSSKSKRKTDSSSKKSSTSSSSLTAPSLKKPNLTKHDDLGPEDDWMSSVENAITMALKKDGIELPAPKCNKPLEDQNDPERSNEHRSSKISGSTHSKSKKRKRRGKDKEGSKKHKADPDRMNDLQISDDIDEYEMMNIRGGSPPSDLAPSTLTVPPSSRSVDYYSDDSYSSYGSYDSGDRDRDRRLTYDDRRHRQRQQRNKDRRGGGSSRKGGREKNRRRDDSDDDRGGGGRNEREAGPRKMELCKFYLMDCCAKREKCFYMHSDFPCKFYYLGMQDHDQSTCKFAHGKPLSDQLRNILLKHLATAPKEILGDFPHISRESAQHILNQQHQKLLKEYGMLPDPPPPPLPNIVQSTSSSLPAAINQSAIVKLPSLLELITEKPTMKPSDKEKTEPINNKSDKPRKTRWCDWTPPAISVQHQQQLQQQQQQQQQLCIDQSTPSYLSLRNLTGVITPEQINNLASMGIESLDQINQLTVAQLNQFGLDITQIHELQLNAMNMQKLGLTATSTTAASIGVPTIKPLIPSTVVPIQSTSVAIPSTSNISSLMTSSASLTTSLISSSAVISEQYSQPNSSIQSPPLVDLKYSNKSLNFFGNRDQDMRFQTPILPSKTSLGNVLESGDVDMRVLATDTKLKEIVELGSTTVTSTAVTNSLMQPPSVIDYTQYLKDSNLNKTDLEDDDQDGDDGDESSNNLVIADEHVQFDDSWYSSDEEKDQKDKQRKSPELKFENVDNEDSCKVNEHQEEQEPNENVKQNLPRPIPPVYDPSLMYSSAIMNKIDLSSSVSQYLNSIQQKKDQPSTTSDESKMTAATETADDRSDDNDDRDLEDDDDQDAEMAETAFVVSKNTAAILSRDPRKSKQSSTGKDQDYDRGRQDYDRDDHHQDQFKIEYFCRQKSISSDAATSRSVVSSTTRNDGRPEKISIYEYQEDPAKDTSVTVNKDRDMRIYSGDLRGDIDLRLPFKPILANLVPAKEIDASYASHSPIIYRVAEVDVPKPDYSEIRRNIPMVDEILDPRLRRILSIKDTSNGIQSPEEPRPESAVPEIVVPRIDPRRRNTSVVATGSASAVTSSTTSAASTRPTTNIDVQCILQKSIWYRDLSSKQKIMVNQQLALVSAELRKYHLDQSPDKVFDLTFVQQNTILQQVLTNLGIYIDENGQFVQLQSPDPSEFMQPQPLMPSTVQQTNVPPSVASVMGGGPAIMGGGMGMVGPMGGMEWNQQGQGPMTGMNLNPRFVNPPGQRPFFQPDCGDGRPSLLGAPPRMPMFNMYPDQNESGGGSGVPMQAQGYQGYDDGSINNGNMYDYDRGYNPNWDGGNANVGVGGPSGNNNFNSGNYNQRTDEPRNQNRNRSNRERWNNDRGRGGGGRGGGGRSGGGSGSGTGANIQRGDSNWGNGGNSGGSGNNAGGSGSGGGRRSNYDPRDWNSRRDKTKN